MTLDQQLLRPRRRVRAAAIVRAVLFGTVLVALIVDRRAVAHERDQLSAELAVAKAKQRVARSAAQLERLADRAASLPLGDDRVTIAQACLENPLAKGCQ